MKSVYISPSMRLDTGIVLLTPMLIEASADGRIIVDDGGNTSDVPGIIVDAPERTDTEVWQEGLW